MRPAGALLQNETGPRPLFGRPRRLLFLSDCYLTDALWAPFHKALLAHLGSAFAEVLAVRTNCYFHPWTHRPRSAGHLYSLRSAVTEVRPDVIFSGNRRGLSESVVDAAAGADRLTLFVDYFDRLGDDMHAYDGRDLVWITSTGRLYDNFLARFADRLQPNQTVATHWCVDHHLFRPAAEPRTTDVVFVGSPFSTRYFAELLDCLRADPANRAAFLAVHERHRAAYVYDWPAALTESGFDADRLPPNVAALFRDNRYLQAAV